MLDKNKLKSMTKKELEVYGRTLGIELDRRKRKSTLVDELIAFNAAPIIVIVEDTEDVVEEVTVSPLKVEPIVVKVDPIVVEPVVVPSVDPDRARRRKYMAL